VKKITFPHEVKRGSVSIKIYKTPSHGCDSFTLSYYQDRVRKRPTFPTLEKALAEAELVAGRLAATDADVLTLTSADRASYLRGRAILDPLGISIEMAAATIARLKQILGDTPPDVAAEYYKHKHPIKIPPRLVKDVVADLLAAKEADGLSERYVQSLKWALGRFREAFQCNIGAVSGTNIDTWLRGLKVSPRTRNNLRGAVQVLFSYAKGRRHLPKDHDELEAVPVAKDRDGEIEIFTPAELAEILSHAGDRLIPFFALGAFAGIRHAEIQRLDWHDVRFEDGIVEVHAKKAKTASRRTVPIVDGLKAWLLPHRKANGHVCAYQNMAYEIDELVRRINKARRASWAMVNDVSAEALEKAEKQARARLTEARKAKKRIPRGELPPAGAETAEIEGWTAFEWKHNALRHSFISYRVADTQNVAQVALEAGNSPQMIFKHYRELVRPADAKTWFATLPGGQVKVVEMKKAA